MKRALAILVVLAIIMAIGLVGIVQAGTTTVNIAITAQGSEISITCNQTDWDAGTLAASETAESGLSWGQVENDGGAEAVDISIRGYDMTGGAVTWTLSDDGNAGSGIIGMNAGLEGGSYNIVIKKNASYNLLVDELATDATQNFGLQLKAPTAAVGNEAMTMASSGLLLTGLID